MRGSNAGRGMRVGLVALLGAMAAVANLAPVAPARAAEVTVRSAVSATHVPLGESIDWVVSIEGVMGADAPSIPPLDFAHVDFGGSSQEMNFVNGQMSARTVFQYRVTPTREGRFALPSVRVRAQNRFWTTDAVAILVTPPQPGTSPSFGNSVGSATTPRLKLSASADPRTVVVGQPIVLTIRLYQGTRLLGDPDFRGPDTPQFYVENSGIGRTYYEGTGPDRWLVGERKTVLYPTTSGHLTIGPATMTCLVADPDAPNGLPVNLASDPIPVDVRPLPPAPAGYGGAVADAELSGTVDRTTIRADESILVTFRLAGTGNLRLAPAPEWKDLEDFDLFEKKEDDSLAVEEGRPEGTKRLYYTLLPRRPGVLRLPPLRYVTYVPGQGYRTLSWAGATIEVTPGLARDARGSGNGERIALSPTREVGGGAWTPGRPFVGGALAALGLAAWIVAAARRRRAAAGRADGGGAATLRAAARALEEARGKDDARTFFARAEEALRSLPNAPELHARVAEARYAPGGGAAEAMARLGPDLSRALLARAAEFDRVKVPLPVFVRGLAMVLVGLALAGLALGAYRAAQAPAQPDLAPRLARAVALLEAGQVPAGEKALLELWSAGAHRPGVAFDLAVAADFQKRLGEAALWTERGRRIDPRHPLASDLAQALVAQDAWEGLPTGALAATTVGELAFAALLLLALAGFACAAGGTVLRGVGAGLLLLALVAAGFAVREAAVGQAPGRAVVVTETPLADTPGGPSTVTLEAGRAVWVVGQGRGVTHVRVSGQVDGWVAAGAVRQI